jgi:hypothetical protein
VNAEQASKAGFGTVTTYRIEADPRLPPRSPIATRSINRSPIAMARLTKKPSGRIAGAVVAIDHPASARRSSLPLGVK